MSEPDGEWEKEDRPEDEDYSLRSGVGHEEVHKEQYSEDDLFDGKETQASSPISVSVPSPSSSSQSSGQN
jgi:hypothetical protein